MLADDPDAVPVRDAATVVLLRDGVDGVESWLLSRRSSLVFAGGMTVFPGGRVEAADAALPLVGDVAAVADRFGSSVDAARCLVGGAVREVFEETGVLLTSPVADLRASRADVESGALDFGELLSSASVSVDVSLLAPWSRWVTPAGEVRRYDTRFFVAALPAGAEAADVTTESSAAAWVPVRLALAEARSGTRAMLPPTVMTLASLEPFATVAEALAGAAARDLGAVRPTLTVGADGSVLVALPTGETVTLPPR